MPAWTFVSAAILAVAVTITLTSGAITARSAPDYVAPTDAPTPAIPQPMPLAVFLGDSYTQGVGGGGVTWPDLVGSSQGWDVDNLGLGGTGYLRTAGAKGCGRAFCGDYQEASAEIIGMPSYIFVSGGRNDLGLPVPDLGKAADSLFADLQTRFPQAKIFVILPWFDDDPPPSSPADFITALKAAANKHGVTIIDTGQPLFEKSELISDDGIHPNADGYRVLADAVDAVLDKTLPHTDAAPGDDD